LFVWFLRVQEAKREQRAETLQGASPEAPRNSPSIATLQRYASALGFRVEVRFVKLEKRSGRSTRGARVGRHAGTGAG